MLRNSTCTNAVEKYLEIFDTGIGSLLFYEGGLLECPPPDLRNDIPECAPPELMALTLLEDGRAETSRCPNFLLPERFGL